MERFKKILMVLLFPHMAIVIIMVPLAAAGLIYAFAIPGANPYISYAAYAVSAYALTIVCTRMPSIIRWIKKFKNENRYVQIYLSDRHLRMKVSLYNSVTMNTLYAALQFGSGLYYDSIWFYALAGYYVLLAIMRFFLLKETLKEKPGENQYMEWLHYRFIGIILLLMNLSLAVIVFFIVWENRGFEHHYIYTIALAAHTFFSMTMAIINVIKYRRYKSPVMSSAKVISLASALVSMLSMETAMLHAFGAENGPEFRQLMTALTGTGVCVIILAMAVYMIIHGTKEIKKTKGASYGS